MLNVEANQKPVGKSKRVAQRLAVYQSFGMAHDKSIDVAVGVSHRLAIGIAESLPKYTDKEPNAGHGTDARTK